MCAKYVHIVTQAQPSSSRGLQRRRTGRDPGVSAKDDGHSWHHPHGCSHISDNFVSPTSYSTGDTGNVGTFCCLGKIHPGVLFFSSYGIRFSSVSTSQIILHLVIGSGRQFP